MPQSDSKRFLASLRKESVAMAAHYERTKAANQKEGTEADIRKAMHLLLPEQQSQDFYLGSFWGLRYTMGIIDRCIERATSIVVPGQKQEDTLNKLRYVVQNMFGVAAVRASESKRDKGKCVS